MKYKKKVSPQAGGTQVKQPQKRPRWYKLLHEAVLNRVQRSFSGLK